MRHALVFNVISLLTFALAVFFLLTRGLPPVGGVLGGTLVEVSYAAGAELGADSRGAGGGSCPAQVQNRLLARPAELPNRKGPGTSRVIMER